jgi:hypothetical protein
MSDETLIEMNAHHPCNVCGGREATLWWFMDAAWFCRGVATECRECGSTWTPAIDPARLAIEEQP